MKKKQLAALAALLAVLAALYGALVFYNRKEQEEELAREESQAIQVTDLDQIASFTFQAPGQEKLRFKKKGGEWVCTDNRTISINQTYPDNIADTFASLTASRKLEDIDALKDYGLESPAYTVTLKAKDGRETVIKIGNETGEEYYLQTGGEDQVIYTVAASAVETLGYSLEDMQETEDAADGDLD